MEFSVAVQGGGLSKLQDLARSHTLALRGFAFPVGSRVLQTVPLSWYELGRHTWHEALDDDVPGLAAQRSYYFFLALFPALLFLLARASFSSPCHWSWAGDDGHWAHFYFGPDADQNWVWISPGAVAAAILWLFVSLLFKL